VRQDRASRAREDRTGASRSFVTPAAAKTASHVVRASAQPAYSALVSEAVLVPLGGGEIIGDSPDRRVEIISDHEKLHATWSRFGPRREGADLHIHRHHTDLFYVLE
jgi:hypothetical protein